MGGPPLTVLGADPLDPGPVDRPEVPEAPGPTIEGLDEEVQVPPGTLGDRGPSELLAVEQVDLQRPGDIVGAVPVGRVRSVDGSWIEGVGSEDCQGRATHALGDVIAEAPDARMVESATSLFEAVLPAALG